MSAALVGADGPRLDVARSRLPCGLEVAIHSDLTSPLVAVSVWYRVGASDERAGTSGFAHLFEHLFKNSLHLAGRHHYTILREHGVVGANASTSTERTAYHEVVPAAALELALWLESDRMGYFLPAVDQARLRGQQDVVRAERRQRYENAAYGPERFAAAAALYPDGHPLRYLTIGRHEDIEAATLADVAAFYRTWYVPANATLVIAGGVEVAEAEAAVARYFGTFPASVRPARAVPPAGVTPGRTEVADARARVRRLRWVWMGPADGDPALHALELLAVALTAPGVGPLWQALVYQRHLATRVVMGVARGRLGSEVHLIVDLHAEADRDEVRVVLAQAVASACASGVEPARLARIVGRAEASLWWRLEGTLARAEAIQHGLEHWGDPQGFVHELAALRAVSTEATAAAARAVLTEAGRIEIETVVAG